MAISISPPVAIYKDSSNAALYTSTNTWTPTANDTIVGFITAAGYTGTPSLAGGSLTWSLQTSATFNSGASTLYCFTTTVSSALLITPAFTCTGGATGCMMYFLTFTGQDTSTPIVQTKIKNSTTGANPSITFDANLNTNNGYATAYSYATNSTTAMTAPTSWTKDVEDGHTSPTTGMAVCHRAGGESGATITATRTSINHGIIGIEIKVAASGATRVPQLTMLGVG